MLAVMAGAALVLVLGVMCINLHGRTMRKLCEIHELELRSLAAACRIENIVAKENRK